MTSGVVCPVIARSAATWQSEQQPKSNLSCGGALHPQHDRNSQQQQCRPPHRVAAGFDADGAARLSDPRRQSCERNHHHRRHCNGGLGLYLRQSGKFLLQQRLCRRVRSTLVNRLVAAARCHGKPLRTKTRSTQYAETPPHTAWIFAAHSYMAIGSDIRSHLPVGK